MNNPLSAKEIFREDKYIHTAEAIESMDNNKLDLALESVDDLERCAEAGITLLTFSAFHCNTDALLLLLAKGANPNNRGTGSFTPLIAAAAVGCLKCVKALIARGADLDLTNADGESPLHYAVQKMASDFENGDLDQLTTSQAVLTTLIDCKANLNVQDTLTNTPLMIAAEMGCVPAIKSLVQGGANAQIKDMNGLTAAELGRGWNLDDDLFKD